MSGSSSCAGVWNLKDDEGAGGSSRSRPSSRPQSATRPAAGASFTCGSTAPRSPPPRAASPTRPRSALASGVVSSKPSSAQKQAERINRFETDVNPVLGKAVAEAIRADDGNPLYYIGAYLMRASGHAAPPPLPMTMNSLRAGAAAATEAWPPESQPAYTGAESPNGATGTPKSVSTLSAAPEDDENRKMHQRVAQRAVEKGREKKKSATVGEPTWTAKDWLKAEGIADEVCKLFLQPLLKATEKIMGKEKFDDASIELELVRSLHAEADADAGATERAIAALLNESNCLSTLAKFVAKKIDKLGSGATSSGEALNTKFVEDYKGRPMTFGTQKDFFSGLGGLIGPPNPNLLEGMRWEHCERKDSYEKFETSNTQTTTTSHAEFYFVTDPEMLTSQLGTGDDAVKKQKTAENQKRLKGQQKPQLPSDMEEGERDGRVREPKMPVEFQAKLAAKNEQLEEMDIVALNDEEFYAARLYTGPMFMKYNAVLRGTPEASLDWLKEVMDQLCNDNRYVTTLHCINSAIVKLGRLSKPSTVYRGLSGSVLPRQFWKGHGQGGVEFAFMSTTANRKVAMDYAKSKNASNTPATVMEIQMGMIDRGADLAWLSQYPDEKEITFAPFTGLEINSTRVEQEVLVVELRLNVNLMSPTIEDAVAKMRNAHVQLLDLIYNNMRAADAPKRVLLSMQGLRGAEKGREADWFNKVHNFKNATAMALETQHEAFLVLRDKQLWDRESRKLQHDAQAQLDALEREIKDLEQQRKDAGALAPSPGSRPTSKPGSRHVSPPRSPAASSPGSRRGSRDISGEELAKKLEEDRKKLDDAIDKKRELLKRKVEELKGVPPGFAPSQVAAWSNTISEKVEKVQIPEKMRLAAAVCARAGEHDVALSLLHQAWLRDEQAVAVKQQLGKSGEQFDRLKLRRASTKSMNPAQLQHLFTKIDASDMWRLKLAHHLVDHDIPSPWPAMLNRLVVAHKHRAVTPDLHSPSVSKDDEEDYAEYLQKAIIGVVSETLRWKAKPANMESDENAELEASLGMRGLTKDTKLQMSIVNTVATTQQQSWRKATVKNLVRRPLFTAKDAEAGPAGATQEDRQRAKEITVNKWGKGPDGAAIPPTITLRDSKTDYAVEWTDEEGNPAAPPVPGDYVLSDVKSLSGAGGAAASISLSYGEGGAAAAISLNRPAAEEAAETGGGASIVCVAMASTGDKMRKGFALTRTNSRSNLNAAVTGISQLASSSAAEKTSGCFKNPIEHFLAAEMDNSKTEAGGHSKTHEFSRAQLDKGEVLMMPRENEKVNSGPGALLREAAATGNTALLEALIGKSIKGPEIEITGDMLVSPWEADEQATLAVHMAAENGHECAFRLLEKLGGDQRKPVMAFLKGDKKGKRALDLFMEKGYVHIARIGRPSQSDQEMKEVELGDPEAKLWSERVLRLEEGVLEHMNTLPNLAGAARKASFKEGLLSDDPPTTPARQRTAPAAAAIREASDDEGAVDTQRSPSRGRGSPASERASTYMGAGSGASAIKPPYSRQLTDPEQQQLRRLAAKVSKVKRVTALMMACKLPRRADAIFAVSALLHAGAGPNDASDAGCTALTMAAEMGYDAVCELLIKAGAEVDARLKDGKTALMLACKNGHENVAKVLLEHGFDGWERHKENGATDFEDPEKTEKAEGFTPLMHAAILGKHECVDVLIKAHYKYAHRANGWEESEQYDTSAREYEITADTNISGDTALMLASMNGQRKVVQTLLREGAKVDTKNNKGMTALHWAAKNGHSQVVCALLTGGADVDLVDDDGFSALHHCCITSGGETVVDALLEVGAKVDAQANVRGGQNTALHFACMAGNHRMVDALLRHKADVSLRNVDGKVPFMLAKVAGHDFVMYKLQPVATSLTANHPAIDTLEKFAEARKFVAEYGLQRLKREMVAPGFVDKKTGELTTTYSPMNVWALAGAGKLGKIPGMEDDEHEDFMAKIERANAKLDAASAAVLKRREDEWDRVNQGSAAAGLLARPPIDPEFSERFVVRLNQPSQDEVWNISRGGSMSKRHRFLIIKKLRNEPKALTASLESQQQEEQADWLDYNWTWFNVLSFGMRDVDPDSQLTEGGSVGPDDFAKIEADPEANRVQLRRALNQLVDMRDAAYAWVRAAARDAPSGSIEHGWTQDKYGTPHLDDLAVDRFTGEEVPGSVKHVGLYFYCYPLVQVNSLCLHIVDEYGGMVMAGGDGNLGPGFQDQKKKLLHIDFVIGALQREIAESDNERSDNERS